MMHYRSLVVIVFGIVMQAGMVKAACSGPTQLTAVQIKEALDAHNFHRAQAGDGDAANVLKLVWSDELASRAQDWANLCEWNHSLMNDCKEKNTVGQNIGIKYMLSGNAYPEYSVTQFVGDWASEKQNYTYADNSCSAVCGHYTQVVWANTAEVGCGIKLCETINSGGKKVVMFGCDYSPPGNSQGQKPYVQGSPCSACSSVISTGGYFCENNLCVPCTPASNGDKCICKEKACQNGGNYNPGTCACYCPQGQYYGTLCENKCECVDAHPYAAQACPGWKAQGYCENSGLKAFMTDSCSATCGFCNLPASCSA